MSVGDGTTSEGEFWESLNSACLGQLPVVYVVEDNGYAISVPVEVQTAGGDISRLVSSFPGLFVQSIDGTDFLASYRAMSDAIAYARARKGPALVHAQGHPAVLAFAVGRREAVQDVGRARGGVDARSDRQACRTAESRAARHRRGPRRDSPRRRPRGERRRRASGAGAQADARYGRALRLLARRRSHVRAPSPPRRRPRAGPTRWWRPSTAR